MPTQTGLSFPRLAAKISGYTPSYAVKLLRAAGLTAGCSRENMHAFFKNHAERRDRNHGCARGMIEIDGESRSFASWCRKVGMRYETVRHRVVSLMKRDPSMDRYRARVFVLRGILRGDVDFPTRGGGTGRRITRTETYEINGSRRTVHDWAKIAGVLPSDVHTKMRRANQRGKDPVDVIRRCLRRAGIAA